MTNLNKRIAEAQGEWDRATHAYSRYPGAEEWQAFLDAKKKVEKLKADLSVPESQPSHPLKKADPETPFKKKSPYGETQQRVLERIVSKGTEEISWNDLLLTLKLTKDQLRHALLKLLKDGRIEKVKTGWYKIREEKKDE